MRIILLLLVVLCGSVLGSTIISHFSEAVDQRNSQLCAIDESYCAN